MQLMIRWVNLVESHIFGAMLNQASKFWRETHSVNEIHGSLQRESLR